MRIKTVLPFMGFSFLFLFFFLSCDPALASRKHKPLAKDGTIDLSQWDFNHNQEINLDGMWVFHWEKILNRTNFKQAFEDSPPQLIHVPGRWQSFHENTPAMGFATYQLKVMLPEQHTVLGISVKDISSVWEIYIDNSLLLSSGQVATRKGGRAAYKEAKIMDYSPRSKEILITIVVSNYHDINGGIMTSIKLGKWENILTLRANNIARDLFLVGCIIIIGFYHLGLFFLRKSELQYLYFGLLCMLIGFRALLTGERFFNSLFPGYSFDTVATLESVTFPLAIIVFLLFLKYLFPKQVHRSVVTGLMTLSGLYAVVILFSPVLVFGLFLLPYQILIILSCVYIFSVMINAVYHKEPGALAILIGFSFLALALTSEILYLHELSNAAFFVSYGMLVFVFLQAFYLSKKYALTFNRVENLSTHLNQLLVQKEKIQEELEERVLRRTKDLRKAKDEAEKANNAKSEFLTNMSHEMRTPLNGIMGFGEILLQTDDKEEQQKHTRHILKESDKLLALINQLLELSKIETRTVTVENERFDIGKLLRDLGFTFKEMIKDKDIEYVLKVYEELPVFLYGDARKLRQILLNLLGNALKFTELGVVRLEVAIQERSEDSIKLLFLIKDTGIGIPRKDLTNIFQLFVQGDGSSTRRWGGSGSGTAIAKKLVEILGGEIGVDSVEGKGSSFWFTLNFNLSEQPITQISNKTEQIPAKNSLQDKIILLAEDYEPNQHLVQRFLENEGCELLLAANGKEALEIFQEKKVDLILMDVQMPEIDGYITTRLIRATEKGKKIPILAVTANTYDEEAKKCATCGMDDLLNKPIRRNLLINTLRHWCGDGKKRENAGTQVEQQGSTVPLDYDLLREQFKDNQKRMGELLGDFLTTARENIIQIENHLDKKEFDSVAKLAHALKGGALNITARDLSLAASELEKAAVLGHEGSWTVLHLAKVKAKFLLLESYIKNG